jgi:hypothetical protein
MGPDVAWDSGLYEALCGFANTHLGWGHFNAEGHRVAGELIATTIVDLLAQNSI